MLSLQRLSRTTPAAWCFAVVVAAALAGCGGGSDGGSTGGTGGTSPTVILDSFGLDAGGDGSSGVGVGDAGADGTAGEGAPIVGGRVEVIDVNGRSVSATTDSQGYYRVKVTGFTPPFVAKVTKPNGQVLHSLNVTPLKVNGFVTVNITGLTDKIASDVAVAAGRAGAAQLTPQIVAANGGALAQSLAALRAQLSQVIGSAGLDPSNFDPLGMPFRPNLRGYDFVLENVVITVDGTGRTQLAVSPTYLPPLSGSWSLTVTDQADPTDTYTSPTPRAAAVVPDRITAQQASLATLLQPVIEQDAFEGKTATLSGNTLTVTGPGTNLQVVINSYTVTAYQSCGTCGVGSTVSYVLTLNATSNGTLEGMTFVNHAQITALVIRFRRTS